MFIFSFQFLFYCTNRTLSLFYLLFKKRNCDINKFNCKRDILVFRNVNSYNVKLSLK